MQQRLGELVPFVWFAHLKTVGVIARAGVNDVVDSELPGGQPGQPLTGFNHPFAQIWLDQ